MATGNSIRLQPHDPIFVSYVRSLFLSPSLINPPCDSKYTKCPTRSYIPTLYSQGALGAADPLAGEAVRILRDNDIGTKMSGQTRFGEDLVDGIIGPVTDSSIDELMSSKRVIANGRPESGPGAETVLVFETPAAIEPPRKTLHERTIHAFAAHHLGAVRL